MFSRLPNSLRKNTGFRLTFWYALISVVSSLLLFLIVYFLVSSSLKGKDRQIIMEKISRYSAIENLSGIPSLLENLKGEKHDNEFSNFFVMVKDVSGRVLFISLPYNWTHIDTTISLPKIQLYENQWQTLSMKEILGRKNFKDRHGRSDELDINAGSLSSGATLMVGISTEEREDFMEQLLHIFEIVVVPIILLGIAGGFFISRRALRPVQNLIHTVKKVQAGKMNSRVPASETGNELDELVRLFNDMLERIEVLILGMKESLDNVSHDLRTPLARMRGVIEEAVQAGENPEKLRNALLDCGEESEKISRMLSTLMDISEAETGTMNLYKTETNLASLMEDIRNLYDFVAEDRNIDISVSIPQHLTVHADPNRIRQVIANLVDNAIKYTPENGSVRISAKKEAGKTIISVNDSGKGIPPEDLPRIFDRLYRGDKSRSERGLGLGLSLVKAVIQAHDGEISVESQKGNTTFTITLYSW